MYRRIDTDLILELGTQIFRVGDTVEVFIKRSHLVRTGIIREIGRRKVLVQFPDDGRFCAWVDWYRQRDFVAPLPKM